MLVLTRKKNQSIAIGDNITITVVQISPGKIRLGIKAPKSIKIKRQETSTDATDGNGKTGL